MSATPNKTQIAITKCVMSLRASNPQGWADFLHALAERIDFVTEQFVSSSPASLAEMQGRAREARDLFSILDGAPKLAEQIQQQERTNGSRPNTQSARP